VTQPPAPTEESEPASPADDPDIPDEEILYRRLSYDNGDWVTTHPVTGERRPVSGAFQPDYDGLSVFRRSLLLANDPPLSARDVMVDPQNLVVGFTVGDVRSINLGVIDDPWPKDVRDPDHPRYGAHALILGLNGLSKGARIKQQRRLATLPSMRFVHG
jgi:hypothetical protein